MLAVRTSGSTCKPLNRATATLSGRLSATSAGTNRSAEFLARAGPSGGGLPVTVRKIVAAMAYTSADAVQVWSKPYCSGAEYPASSWGLRSVLTCRASAMEKPRSRNLSVGADEDVLRADAQMQNPRRVQGGQRGHQRHEQRTHLVPAQPPARLGQSGLQGNTLAVFSHRVGRMVLLENVVQRNDGRQIPHPGQRPRVAAELAEIIGEGVLSSAENLQLPGVSPGA